MGKKGRMSLQRSFAKLLKINGLRELSTSSVVSQHRNPRDPISWSSPNHKIPIPSSMKNYDPDIRPGTEKWHEPIKQPFSGEETFGWPTYNDRVYAPDGTFRPAFVCHMRTKIKYFIDKKGARIIEEVLMEAREMALSEHHFEFPTNMWVAESFSESFENLHSIRRHARSKIGNVVHRYITYFIRLEEGVPPEHYYDHRVQKNPKQMLEEYVQEHRSKYIHKW